MYDFMIKVDGGEARSFAATHGSYSLAVMEAFGCEQLPFPCEVEIWSPELLPDHGPYKYRIDDFVDAQSRTYVSPAVMPAPMINKEG